MKQKEYDSLIFLLKDYLLQKDLILLKEKLEQLRQNKKDLTWLFAYPLKSPVIGLMLSLFFGIFAVDRFYKGDIFLAFIKLNFFLTPLTILYDTITENIPNHSSPLYFLFATEYPLFLCILSSIVWTFADIYLVFVGIKKDNFNKIINVLSLSYPSKD